MNSAVVRIWDGSYWRPSDDPETPPEVPEGDDLNVIALNTNTAVSTPAIYVVDTTSGIVTITLLAISAVPAEGAHIVVIRKGPNEVYVEPSGADTFWDGTTQKTIFDDNGAYATAVATGGTQWQELGRFRTVT